GHVADGGGHGLLAGAVVGEPAGVGEALGQGVHVAFEVVVVRVDGLVADLPGLGAAGHQGQVLVPAGLEGGDPGVVEDGEGADAVVVRVVQAGAGEGVADEEPEEDRGGGDGGGHQAVVEDAVGAQVI